MVHDAIQVLVNQYYDTMINNINTFAKNRSHLSKDEFIKALCDHLTNWKLKLQGILDDSLADPVMKEIAGSNLYHINNMIDRNLVDFAS